jgi:3D (Asp-Asp-Asp) domain-containing protein
MYSRHECVKLNTENNKLNITIAEQMDTIENLQKEKNDLEAKVAELEKQIKINKTQTAEKPKTVQSQEITANGTSLGQFKITAYCNCSKCCGKWAGGPTASGTMPKAGRTIAVDPKVIPLGTKVIIDGHTYIAEDTGSAIKGKKIDMYFGSHSEAMAWGVKHKNVQVIQ